MMRRAIPILPQQQPVARDQRGVLIGITLIVLHLASAVLALIYF